MTNNNQRDFKNLNIAENRDSFTIEIRKKNESSMFIFIVIFFGFIAAMLFWLIPMAEENNTDADSNTLRMIKLIILSIGGIGLILFILEVLKREVIHITSKELIPGYTILGRKLSQTKYLLEKIQDLKPAERPDRGWKLVKYYESNSRVNKIYTFNSKKYFPTVSFMYKGSEVLIAKGLTADETNAVIQLIKKPTNTNFSTTP